MLIPDISPPRPLVIFLALALIVAAAGFYWLLADSVVHSSFDRLYESIGCREVISRSDDSGICRTASGEVLHLVHAGGGWYLEGEEGCGFICIR